MADDISRRAVIVLVLLTLAASALGTWTVLDAVSEFRPQATAGTAEGEARLTILPPAEPLTGVGGGRVGLIIS